LKIGNEDVIQNINFNSITVGPYTYKIALGAGKYILKEGYFY